MPFRRALFVAVAVAVLIPATMLAQVPPDQQARLEYETACNNAAAAIVSNAEQVHSDQLPGWIKKCNAHPDQSSCRETAQIVKEVTGKEPFACGKSN
jgi:hypothetical protein